VYGTKLGYLIVLFELFGVLQIPALLQSAIHSLPVRCSQAVHCGGWSNMAITSVHIAFLQKKVISTPVTLDGGIPLNDAFNKGFHQTKAHMHQQKYT
jgi:hypothetical protein